MNQPTVPNDGTCVSIQPMSPMALSGIVDAPANQPRRLARTWSRLPGVRRIRAEDASPAVDHSIMTPERRHEATAACHCHEPGIPSRR